MTQSPLEPEEEAFAAGDEEDLLVVLRLSNPQMGTTTERAELEEFAERLEQILAADQLGEYDGNEIGGGEFVMFFCGPCAEGIYDALRPALQQSPYGRGALIRMQRGDETVEKLV